ncbi:MAG: hypothetical protein K0R73_525 [Candidatus Midichloriaceae bacterium]|nr:hypothetical protein [Candidatus Midichloriaceae bacterium]
MEVLLLNGIKVPDKISDDVASEFCKWKLNKYREDITEDEALEYYELINSKGFIISQKPPTNFFDKILTPPYIYQINIPLYSHLENYFSERIYTKYGAYFVHACKTLMYIEPFYAFGLIKKDLSLFAGYPIKKLLCGQTITLICS